jgi:hypothetical protein
MGRRIRWREARRREAELRISAVLEANSRSDARPGAPVRFIDFKPEYRVKVEALRSYALRAPEDWRCRIKSRSEERRFIDLLRFTFARFRVAPHLERVWIDPVWDDFVDRLAPPNRQQMHRLGAPDLLRWYLIAAQGGSLYRQEARAFLSKQETHYFLTTPADITSTKHAFWFAVARAQTDDIDVARRVARCKLVNYSIASTYWKEVARFFARNPLPLHEMDDLVDFLFVEKQRDAAFTLKGRTPEALKRKMEDWHHTLRRNHAVGGGAWTGSPLPDVDYETGKDDKRAIWRVRQIKAGNELFREGERMHHCVVTYKPACMRGEISIWSITCEFPIGRMNRGVTLEVTRDGRIVQCRGFANRAAAANEAMTAKRWASEHGLTWDVQRW